MKRIWPRIFTIVASMLVLFGFNGVKTITGSGSCSRDRREGCPLLFLGRWLPALRCCKTISD